ncbi:MAG: type-F conjugative transfer system protein TraW [Oligoflexia bacterium]|nr:type-F conjugative transfer system protein TraW [Oligoflexia bacterium]
MTVAIKTLERYLLLTLLVLLIACSELLFAGELGVIGKTYQIEEEDLVVVMQRKIMEKQKSGELEKEMMAFKDRSEKLIRRPLGIKMNRAKEYKIKSITILYKLSEDISDASGKILYKAGTEVNPLKIKKLSKALCFFDGDDQKQVEWVNKTCAENKLNKLIMTSGDFLDLSNKYQRRFYFDQRGALVARLGIESLPAVVRQQGEMLYVEEFPIN